jgi:hypothetical protein
MGQASCQPRWWELQLGRRSGWCLRAETSQPRLMIRVDEGDGFREPGALREVDRK